VLVLARKDGKLVPKLTESKEGSCPVYDPANLQAISVVTCGTRRYNPVRPFAGAAACQTSDRRSSLPVLSPIRSTGGTPSLSNRVIRRLPIGVPAGYLR
jgi:hypothetical protein